MAGAHGAGLMVLPVVAAEIPQAHPVTGMAAAAVVSGGPSLAASAVHTAAMLGVMALVAWLVFRYTGVGVLRRAWVNLDVIWAFALVVAGVAALFT
jgi:hypothetical protein